jgi:hypothetical protein
MGVEFQEEELKEKNLLTNLDKINSSVERNYLYDLEDFYVVSDFEEYNKRIDNNGNKTGLKITREANIGIIKVERWVFDKKETIINRFKNIYNAFSNSDENLALVINRTNMGADLYFVIKNETSDETGSRREDTKSDLELLKSSIKGNFPGTRMQEQNPIISSKKSYKENVIDPKNEFALFWDKFENDESDLYNSVAVLSSITSGKSEEFISQGLEKLLDGIVPQEDDENYVIIMLAQPMTHSEIHSIRVGIEELASKLTPYATHQFSEGSNKSTTSTEIDTLTDTKGTNKSIAKTNGVNGSISKTVGKAVTNAIAGTITGGASFGISELIKASASLAISVSHAVTKSESMGGSLGFSHSRTKTEGSFESQAGTSGINYSIQKGKNENRVYTYKSYSVLNILQKLEEQLERVKACEALGMWKHATYVFAKKTSVSKNVANFIKSLAQGEKSHTVASVVNEWYSNGNKEDDSNYNFINIKKFVSNFTHPVFLNALDLNYSINEKKNEVRKQNGKVDIERLRGDIENDMFQSIEIITPAMFISTIELAQSMNFPQKSVQGLSSLECIPFGRNVLSYARDDQAQSQSSITSASIKIGCVQHMLEDEEDNAVFLDIDSLASHVFVTGSTGSGKSNTIYTMLEKLQECENRKIHFMVVEPAKGEYKDALGKFDTVVYGTNPLITDMIKINPFSFPKSVHVLEHIDRLIEIFNACWPMYAAMPAILKDAIEKAYQKKGWNLFLSTSSMGTFPDFNDLIDVLEQVVNSSAYSNDTKGDYKGALVTRVHSLTTGLYGQVFCSSNEVSSEQLFENNVIVDLSRVGSTESKSLIMGVLVMKLQEYRMDERVKSGCASDETLKHITVLEEAHTLLRRNNIVSGDTGNIQVKAIEMISNAIAEMRTYGEGFIIADQAPGLLDMATIRNTNTKIIMRLPDESDRLLVGKSANLNDKQIAEIARLGKGVAAIYQNDWIEPILCKIPKFSNKEKCSVSKEEYNNYTEAFFNLILRDSNLKNELKKENAEKIKNWIYSSNISYSTKCLMEKTLSEKTLTEDEKDVILYNYFNGKSIAAEVVKYPLAIAYDNLGNLMNGVYGIANPELINTIIDSIVQIVRKQIDDINTIDRFTEFQAIIEERRKLL